MSYTFSRLSKGYGTWDGIAKIERCQSPDRSSDFFSLDELYLPPIENKYRKPDDSEDYVSSYKNKMFELPKVETKISYPAARVPKTYTTRKGALLLYAEDYFIPGSSKPRKRKRKPRRQTAVTFNTLGDLRDSILSYKKNGGDPLFLHLLQKTYSSYRERAIRPGFSPKRYIANLGRTLQDESWDKLAASGSLKDPTLKCYDRHAGFLPLPDKPQPYSTMSLPPISPSHSMLDHSFNFYQNGMSTGAASLISLNSEDQSEYAPSSRALSPAESLSERLSEVNSFPVRKDNRYASLNSRQKADLLSQMLVHSTLQGDSDMQGWETDFSHEALGMEKEPSLPGVASKGRTRKGSLRSANTFPSVPRLPPIQSAGAPTTCASTASSSDGTPTNSNGDVDFETSKRTHGKEMEDSEVLDPSAVELFVCNDKVGVKEDVMAENLAYGVAVSVDESESNTINGSTTENVSVEADDLTSRGLEKPEDGDLTNNSISMVDSHNAVEKDNNDNEGDGKFPLDLKSSEIYDSSNAADSIEGDKIDIDSKQELVQKEEGGGANTDIFAHEDNIGKHDLSEDEKGNISTGESETEIHGVPVSGKDDEKIDAELEAKGTEEADSVSGVTEEKRPVLPTHISLEELHGHARVVASKVLSRPKSGVCFMADARAAVAMWADRLSSILGPLPKDARVSSAGHSPGHDPQPAADDTPSTQLKSNAKQRKVSRSAGPSLAALREALKISGGDFKQELLKDFDDLSDKINRMPRGKVGMPSRVKTRHTYYEPLKDGESGSMRSAGSPGPTQSIQSERVSLSDLQMDIFSLVTGQQETMFDYHNAEFLSDNESEEDADNFRAAVMSVLSEHSDKKFSVIEEKPKPKAAIARKTSSGKSEIGKAKADELKTKNGTPPFQVTRPKDEKPPPGLQNKVAKTKTKGSKQDKKPVSKPTKKTTKKVQKGKTAKSVMKEKEKPKDNQGDAETVMESVNTQEMEKVDADSPGPTVRVDSETGEREPEVLSVTSPVSPLLSGVSASRSSKATTGEPTSPTMTNASSVVELPKLVPRPVEPVDEVETVDPDGDSAAVEEARLRELEAQKAKEARAHKRAAERAAAAERRRLEVERKRKEREEAKKKALEEEARLEKLRADAEEDMKRREEERRRRRDEKEDEKRRSEEYEKEQERLARVKAEREKRQREEWKRKQQEMMAQRKLEEELRREQEKIEAEIEAAARREQEEKLKAMEESERRAFEERMRQEEEELRRRLELQKLKEEEERRVREEQRRKHQEERALLRQKQLQRQLFIAGLFKEQHFLSFSQRLTRAFTFSYFNLLPWSYLKHFKSLSPVGEGHGNKRIPPTIVEEDEKEPMAPHVD